MKNKTTYLKFASILLGMVVLFFSTVLKVEGRSLFPFVSESFVDEEKGQKLDRVCYVDPIFDDMEGEGVMEPLAVVDISAVNSFMSVDFDDLEYTFNALSVLSGGVFFFKDVIENYSFIVYRKVKLFLFYSFIKIPTAFL